MAESIERVTHTHRYSLNELLNTITLGDSYEIIKDIPDKSIDLIIIDPPYEFTSVTGGTEFGKRNYIKEYKKVYGHGANIGIDRISEQISDISNGFSFDLLDEFERIQKKTNIYIWCSKTQVRKILQYYEEKDKNIDILCWHKDDPIPMCRK